MLNLKLKKTTASLLITVLLAMVIPSIAQAELGGSGGTAARDAAEQRAARERKLEKKKQKEAEAKAAAQGQQGEGVEAQQPAATTQEKPAE